MHICKGGVQAKDAVNHIAVADIDGADIVGGDVDVALEKKDFAKLEALFTAVHAA